jgi:hypothetical protein
MRQIPGGMNEPCDTDGQVRSKAKIHHRCCQYRIDQFPNTKSSADISSYSAGCKYGVESCAGQDEESET